MEPITRLLSLFTPNPIRISKTALYGLSIHNPKTLLRLEDLNFGEARANPNEPYPQSQDPLAA